MAKIEARFANKADKDAMLEFLKEHWRADHIFVRAPEVFDWQYLNADGGYNIALAVSEGQVLGFLGFIPTGQYDPSLGCRDIMLAVWKVADEIAPPGLGLRLLKLIQGTHKPDLIGAVGISDMVGPIYRAFKYELGQLEHVALFNPARRGETCIAQNVPTEAFEPLEAPRALTLSPVLDDAAVDALGGRAGLIKSRRYLKERFEDHPWYAYTLRGLYDGDALQAVVVWREQEAQGRRILRVVDVLGDANALCDATDALRAAMTEADAEYLDIVQLGMNMDRLKSAGFASPIWTPKLILPNYFSPFVASNVEIKLAYKPFSDPDRRPILFRADSDQDRPNRVEELHRTPSHS